MTTKEKKKALKAEFLKPKTRLRAIRREKELSTSYVAEIVGLERRQYELKEKGVYPFHDYEIFILANFFNIEPTEIFF